MNDNVTTALAKYIHCNPKELTREYESFYTLGRQEYYVFKNVDEAYKYVLEDYGPEFCNGAISDEEWVTYVGKACNYDDTTMKWCFPNGEDSQPDYTEITRLILNQEGVQWFLANYDGNAMFLDYEDYVAYRCN